MDARLALMRIYWWLERRIAPGIRYSQLEYEEVLRENVVAGARWLDLGCGHRLLPTYRAEIEKDLARRARSLVGVDLSREQLARNATIRWPVLASGDHLPFADDSFDLVTANMVVEHLEDPETCFAEVRRTLKPGGRFLFHTPNARGYGPRLAGSLPDPLKRAMVRVLEGRGEDEVFPAHYRANTPEEVTQLAEATGWTVRRLDTVRSVAQTATVPPLAALELLWLRRLGKPHLAPARPIILASLEKPAPHGAGPATDPAHTASPPPARTAAWDRTP